MASQPGDEPLWLVGPAAAVRLAADDPGVLEIHTLIEERACDDSPPAEVREYRGRLHELLDLSPNQVSMGDFLKRSLSEAGLSATYSIVRDGLVFLRTGSSHSDASDSTPNQRQPSRSTSFGRAVRRTGFCRVTGKQDSYLHACHIIPRLLATQQGRTTNCATLVAALFGPEALEALLRWVMNFGDDRRGNIDRYDNGISMLSNVHVAWDASSFILEVDWSTLERSTGQVGSRKTHLK